MQFASLATMFGMALGALVVLGTIVLYNSLIDLRNECARAWHNIDVLLKQRCDEIPQLVAVCKQSAKYEAETLERLGALRSQMLSSNTRAKAAANAALDSALAQVFAVAEQWPDLKASEVFLNLQRRITALEEQIADRREGYNQTVTAYNIRVEQWPDVLIARTFGFRKRDWFRVP